MVHDHHNANIGECVDPREMLLVTINSMPGIRYRELLRLTGLCNGVLAHHLNILEKSFQIRVDRQRENRTTRYYSTNIPRRESDILRQLKNNVSRQIIKFIIGHNLCTFNELVEHSGKASSTVSWYLKRLREAGIISVRNTEYQLYYIENAELVSEVLDKYRESFIDATVTSYSQMIEEL